MKKLVLFILAIFSVSMLFATEPETKKSNTAKSSQIEGKVVDLLTGESLAGVTLRVKGSEIKTYSDLEGNFKIKDVEPGTYDIEIDYVSYKEVTLKGVLATDNEIKLKVRLESASF